MKKHVILSIIFCCSLIISCQQDNESGSPDENGSNVLKLTSDELLCINDDLLKPLSENDVLDLVKEFSASIREASNTKSVSKLNLSINGSFYKPVNASNTKLKSGVVSADSIQVYKISISSNNEEGFSLVSADRRSPRVITYIPNGNLNDTVENRAFACMLNFSYHALEMNVKYYNTIIDSLKESTIKKICDTENISREEYSEENYAGKYSSTSYSENSNLQTKFTPVLPISLWRAYGPLVKTKWGQGYPYNAQVPVLCPKIGVGYNGRAHAGCVAIATGQILAYYKKQPINNANVYNYELFANSSEVHEWETQAVNEVSRFIKNIGLEVNMDYSCNGSGAQSSFAVSNAIVGKYGLKANHLLPMYTPYSFSIAFRQGEIVYARGADSSYGGHAWVIDGGFGHGGSPQIHFDPFGYSVHCNFGWNGSNDGWFEIADNTPGTGWKPINSISAGKNNFKGLEGWIISR